MPVVAEGLFPGLTTLELPHYEMGAWGVRTLIHQLQHPEQRNPAQVVMPCRLISRGSVAGRGPSARPESTAAQGDRRFGVGGCEAIRHRGGGAVSQLKLTSRPSPPSWRAALDCIAVDEQHVSAREVEDFCSLLSIAERVHVVGWRGGGHAATVLATKLTSLGYPTHGVGDRSVVEATDTVVAVCGPDPAGREPSSLPTLRYLTGSGAVLLAIVSDDATPLLTVADVRSPCRCPGRGAETTSRWPVRPSI